MPSVPQHQPLATYAEQNHRIVADGANVRHKDKSTVPERVDLKILLVTRQTSSRDCLDIAVNARKFIVAIKCRQRPILIEVGAEINRFWAIFRRYQQGHQAK